MFKFKEEQLGNFDVISLFLDDKKVMSICPEIGAKITELNFLDGESIQPIFWKSGVLDLSRQKDFAKSDILFPFPNRLKDGQYTWHAKSFQFPVNEPDRNNAIHGFIRDESFSVSKKETHQDYASVTLVHNSMPRMYYPFKFQFVVKYTYWSSNRLEAEFRVTNLANESIPFGLGWHPYFLLGDGGPNTLSIPATEDYRNGDRCLPTGEIVDQEEQVLDLDQLIIDHTLKIKSPLDDVALHLSAGSIQVKIEFSDHFGFLQLYIPKGINVIAIEPMTCGVNALQTGEDLIELGPGESFKANCTIRS